MYDNNSYDRAPSEIGARSFAQIQARFINRVFGWMTLGLAITGIVSVYLATQCGDAVIKYRGLYPVLLIAEVLLVLGLSFLIKRISSAIAFIGFIYLRFLTVLLYLGYSLFILHNLLLQHSLQQVVHLGQWDYMDI